MLLQLGLESKGQGHSKNQKTMPLGAINMQGFAQLLVSNLSVKYVMNDLLTITGRGQQDQ